MAERGKGRSGGKRHGMAQCHSGKGSGEGPGLMVGGGEEEWRRGTTIMRGPLALLGS